MSVRAPQFYGNPSLQSGLSLLEYEIAEERASALGRHGRQVEACLEALRGWDADPARRGKHDRESLVQDAADAVWALFVQRELCGLNNGNDVIKDYQIPGAVVAKVGTIRRG